MTGFKVRTAAIQIYRAAGQEVAPGVFVVNEQMDKAIRDLIEAVRQEEREPQTFRYACRNGLTDSPRHAPCQVGKLTVEVKEGRW